MPKYQSDFFSFFDKNSPLTYPEELAPLVLVELRRPVGAERQHEEGDAEDGVDKVEDGEEADHGERHAQELQALVVLAEGGLAEEKKSELASLHIWYGQGRNILLCTVYWGMSTDITVGKCIECQG